jgi:hypothetical protein
MTYVKARKPNDYVVQLQCKICSMWWHFSNVFYDVRNDKHICKFCLDMRKKRGNKNKKEHERLQ